MKKRLKYLVYCMLIFALFISISIPSSAKGKINHKKLTILVSEKQQLKISSSTGKIKWSSSNKAIATVDKKGNVKGKKPGKAVITATAGNTKYKCKVKVTIGLDKKSVDLLPGSTTSIKLCGAKIKSAKSSNQNVATISGKGVINAISTGNAKVTVISSNNKKYYCNVTVSNNAPSENDSKQADNDDKRNDDSNNESSDESKDKDSDNSNDNGSSSSNDDSDNSNNNGASSSDNEDNTKVTKNIDNSVIYDSFEKALKKTNANSTESKKNIIINTLSSYADKGTIKKDSIYYDANSKCITYLDTGNYRTIICLESIEGTGRNSLSPITSTTQTSLNSNILNSTAQSSDNIKANMLIYYGFEPRDRTSVSMKSVWENMGIHTTVADAKDLLTMNSLTLPSSSNGLSNIVMFSMHGYYTKSNDKGDEISIIFPGEKASKTKDNIYKNRDGIMTYVSLNETTNEYEAEYAITSEYIRKYLKCTDRKTIILLECCYAFGAPSSVRLDIPQAFNMNGFGSVVGFKNSVSQNYSLDFYESFLGHLLNEDTDVKTAIANAKKSKSATGENLNNDSEYAGSMMSINGTFATPMSMMGHCDDFILNPSTSDKYYTSYEGDMLVCEYIRTNYPNRFTNYMIGGHKSNSKIWATANDRSNPSKTLFKVTIDCLTGKGTITFNDDSSVHEVDFSQYEYILTTH